MGWASRRKGGRVGLVDETGRPVPANDAPPEGEQKPEAKPENLKVVIGLKDDGNISIEGPADIRATLALIDEAKNIVAAKLAANFVLAQIASGRQGIQKPGLRDVLALAKGGPR